jgi:hypothetical protein
MPQIFSEIVQLTILYQLHIQIQNVNLSAEIASKDHKQEVADLDKTIARNQTEQLELIRAELVRQVSALL